ncbi:MAG: S1 RNA-binding domain-containing protein [bacterium]
MTDETKEELTGGDASETPTAEQATIPVESSDAQPAADEATSHDAAQDADEDDSDLATDEEIAQSAADDNDSDDDADHDGDADGGDNRGHQRGRGRTPVKRVSNEVRRLMDFATKYPEIGPTVADLAFKLGFHDVGSRVVRMGLESEGERDIEYYFVAAELARREGRNDDALTQVIEGLDAAARAAGEGTPNHRILHLVRIGFAVLMFEINDVNARPEFTAKVVEHLKALQPHFSEDPFFYTLLAQALWSTDREGSEAAWDKAVSLGERETSWNARGTWYKEAEKHLGRAEEAYRRGLKDQPTSALLMHNLAQVLMDRASDPELDAAKAHDWARQADRLMRKAIRATQQPRLRRHIRENIERVQKFRAQLPSETELQAEKTPEVGDVVNGRVRSIQVYGAFLSIPGGHSGLLHKSELAHERIDHPNQVLKVGDSLEVKIIEVKSEDNGTLRIGFSRKAVLPEPAEGSAPAPRSERNDRPRNDRGGQNRDNQGPRNKPANKGGGNRNDNRNDNRNNDRGGKRSNDRAPREYHDPTGSSDDKFGKLGDLLLAKLNLTKDED